MLVYLVLLNVNYLYLHIWYLTLTLSLSLFLFINLKPDLNTIKNKKQTLGAGIIFLYLNKYLHFKLNQIKSNRYETKIATTMLIRSFEKKKEKKILK